MSELMTNLPQRLTPDALRQMTTEDLEAVRTEVEQRLAAIAAQIGAAKADAIETGRYSDPVWFRRAEAARRFVGAAHQNVLRIMGERRREKNAALTAEIRAEHAAAREAKRERANDIPQRFVNAARSWLEPDVFDAIMKHALEVDAGDHQPGRREQG